MISYYDDIISLYHYIIDIASQYIRYLKINYERQKIPIHIKKINTARFNK